LLAQGGEVEVCYEAGPTGYGIQRALKKAGYPCQPACVLSRTNRD